jgi:hypothetical protein
MPIPAHVRQRQLPSARDSCVCEHAQAEPSTERRELHLSSGGTVVLPLCGPHARRYDQAIRVEVLSAERFARRSRSPADVAPASAADADLRRLLAVVVERRHAMHTELQLPTKPQQRAVAQKRLLAALESYTSALAARGLILPPRLRDELSLQRGLGRGRAC